ncbi:sugar phosphate nucleotidyltransferase [Parvularcula maris]|uniref:Phosphocholine cytidylyltransferase family protein n=1 Tax=Parvularcula maris TaxID=2965077 RepID=A0A9X2LB60_9PROT|nr:phosphocholine cytidylyltransferase family protein [Parvularcula maris]MCQ8186326.1 phosphocholine cytidylyltransferase family protein [Parvularcula maris]
MKAIILSAGRGSRLLPLTDTLPKCLLEISGRTVLSLQLDTLAACGVREAVVITGYMPHLVEAEVEKASGIKVRTLFNPFYHIADNLASCWMARGEMQGDFLLINGDTLFEEALLRDVLAVPPNGISVTISKKNDYDDDDMKVTLNGEALTAIGKTLSPQETDAESIGMLRFTGDGPSRYVAELEAMMRTPEGNTSWFLKAINAVAGRGEPVTTCDITGRQFAELDTQEDYRALQEMFRSGEFPSPAPSR